MSFIGEMRGALGFNSLTSLGVGMELDMEQKDVLFYPCADVITLYLW
jgi:hypothetical protein